MDVKSTTHIIYIVYTRIHTKPEMYKYSFRNKPVDHEYIIDHDVRECVGCTERGVKNSARWQGNPVGG